MVGSQEEKALVREKESLQASREKEAGSWASLVALFWARLHGLQVGWALQQLGHKSGPQMNKMGFSFGPNYQPNIRPMT